jgi:hypothetical protein
MEAKLKTLIKEAFVEAFTELYATAAATTDSKKEDDKKKEPIQPGILIGPSGFSLR